MAMPVPPHRPTAPTQQIGFGRPVRSFEWQSAAALSNYCRGRGSVIVPRTFIMETITATNTGTYRFRVRPNQFCTRRIWFLELLGGTASASATASVVIDAGLATAVAAASFTCTTSKQLVVPAPFYQNLATPISAEGEANVSITAPTGSDVIVVSALCVEVPRSELTDNDEGDDLGRDAALQPIDIASLGHVAAETGGATAGALNASRRAGMHSFAMRTEGNGIQFTGDAVFHSLYTASAEAPMLGRYLYSGDTTRTLTFKAYGKITGGATLSVKITMTSGASTTITTTSPAGTWFGSSNTIAVDAEDLTATDGRRSSRFDLAKIEYKTSSAAQTLNLYSVSVWEDLQ